jgi:hypothetical protein
VRCGKPRPVAWIRRVGALTLRHKKEEPIESVLGDMPRTYLVFGDIEGKLDVLRVECTKCDRRGRYHVETRLLAFSINSFI